MILFFYLLLNVLIALIFFKFQKKNIFALEIFGLWIVTTIIYQNYSAFFIMNLKYFLIPDDFNIEMAHFINRCILIPIITITLLNRYIVLKTFWRKTTSILMMILILSAIEWLAHVTGILIHENWKIWWSLSFWILYIFITILFMKYFRKKLAKEVNRK